MNIGSFLVNTAARFGDRPALSWRGITRTYGEFNQRSASLAAAMAASGVGVGDRVVLYMDNRPELLEAMFAAFRAGAAVVPCNSRSTVDELRFICTDCSAKILFTDDAHAEVAIASAAGGQVVSAGDSYESVLGSATSFDPSAVAETRPEDIAWIFYTSGTTGRQKGAMLSHSVLNFVTVGWHADLLPLNEDDITLHAAPLTHGAGFHAVAATAVGAHQFIAPKANFDPSAVFDIIREHGVTNSWMVPTQIIRLTDAAAGTNPVPSMRAILYGGAPMAPTAIRKALDVFGPIFVQLYGQGETPMTITALRPEDHRPELLGTVGHARLGIEMRIVDESDRPVPSGTVGEVVVRGPSVMAGYWQQPEATIAALKNGWLHTGDLGKLSAEGALTLLDRTKDMIISGGSNVYAVEVEAVLSTREEIREVAVVGIPDRLWGERVEAVVVTSSAGDDVEAELDRFCRSKLASYKIPRCYHFVDAIPRNAYGKVSKRALREMLIGAHGEEPNS